MVNADSRIKKITIIDYGMGNVRSIKNALLNIGGFQVDISSDFQVIKDSDFLILPGVGAFPDAMDNLRRYNLIDLLNHEVLVKKKPIIGICLGMQLLFDGSDEGGGKKGLGWIPGNVKYMALDKHYRVPHVGWNDLILKKDSMLFDHLGDDKDFYFVHSFHADCPEVFKLATFCYGSEFTASVQHENILGMQFHPEKSQKNGLNTLKQAIAWAGSLWDA